MNKAENLALMKNIARQRDPEQLQVIADLARVGGISEGAAVALSLCRDALWDYCPDNETTRVVALLLRMYLK